MEALSLYLTPTLLFPLAVALAVFLFFSRWWSVAMSGSTELERINHWVFPPRFSFSNPGHAMERKDILPLLLVTVIYAVSAFWALGSTSNPQSFQKFTDSAAIEFSLDQEVSLSGFEYYSGLGTGEYTLEYSLDGADWESLPTLKQTYVDLFKWHKTDLDSPVQARLFRLTASGSTLELGELALYDGDGMLNLSSMGVISTGADALFDEQETVPDEISYLNSTYFDEIYHARTAYEHIRNVSPYEITHPPLGKILIGLGIRAFGMTPFGWRFVGTLFGVLMLPLFYLFIKNLFGKTALALCGTSLFAFDFMHLTQTRISTIDTYAVFFIMAMYYFFWRWLSLPAGTSFRKCAVPLFLSGLMFGIGASCKWTVIYAVVGLAALYFVNLWQKYREWPRQKTPDPWEEMGEAESKEHSEESENKESAVYLEHTENPAVSFASWAIRTLLFSVLVFVAVPLCIYIVSYLPYAQARGDVSLHTLLSVCWENQKYMLSYHSKLVATHPYSSKWWQWLFDIRPILYYREMTASGLKSAFASFNNPVVSWLGLLSVFGTAVIAVRRRSALALFIVVGYLSQLLPWIFITRLTFAYHYFPSILFLTLAVCVLMNDLMERQQDHWRLPVYGITGLSAGLYALFYPVLTGIPIPASFATHILQWFPSWPL